MDAEQYKGAIWEKQLGRVTRAGVGPDAWTARRATAAPARAGGGSERPFWRALASDDTQGRDAGRGEPRARHNVTAPRNPGTGARHRPSRAGARATAAQRAVTPDLTTPAPREGPPPPGQ